jgi:hypothetical protein
MKTRRHRPLFLGGCAFFMALLVAENVVAASSEARVTQAVRDVKLLPSESKPKPAVVNDKVSEGTGVRTGDKSRSELTFGDLTIERLGANTFFSFNKAGRSVELDGGSMLLRVPKDSGGARLSLNKYPKESVFVRGGQMEDVPPGATKLPPPTNINIDEVMNKNPLITDFPPLPSRDLIYASKGQPPVSQGQPVGGSVVVPPIISGILGTAIGVPRGGTHVRERNRPDRTRGGKSKETNTRNPNADVATGGETNTQSKPTPTPSKRKKPKGR